MIIKNYELNKNSISGKNFFLFYGNNEGLKNEIIKKNFSDNKIINFDEKEVLENEKNFIDNILSKSLFEENKTVVIKRSSDKICKIIEKIKENIITALITILFFIILFNKFIHLITYKINIFFFKIIKRWKV